jgi:Tol biopolymer transport system component
MKIALLIVFFSIAALSQTTPRSSPGKPITAKPARASVRLVTREVSLGKVNAGEIAKTRTLSPDGRRVAFVAKVATGESVFVDGKPGKTYAQIARDPFSESGDSFPILFSPDSKRVACVAKRGPKYLVVLDGKESNDYDYVHTATLDFSPDGRRFAFSAKRADKSIVVIDGIEVTQYDYAVRPRFSEDGQRVSFEARRAGRELFVVDGVEFNQGDAKGKTLFYGEKVKREGRQAEELEEGGKTFVVVDGTKLGPYDHVGSVRVSDDGKRVMYEARRGEKFFVVVDGVEGTMYDSIESYSATFSPDGKHFAYKARHADQHFIVLDGVEDRHYDYIGDLTFSSDGEQLMYMAFKQGNTILVTDGVEGATFPGRPGRFHFSADRKRMFYTVNKLGSGSGPGREFVILDGVAYAYDQIRNIQFSPNGRLIFKAQRGGVWLMVLDGAESKEYEPDGSKPGEVAWSENDEIAFSEDDARVAYVARRAGKDFVVTDGEEGKPYDEIRNLGFTSDGRHVVYTAQRSGKYLVVVDGVEGREYDRLLGASERRYPGLRLDGPDSLYFLATRGRENLRVEVDIIEE